MTKILCSKGCTLRSVARSIQQSESQPLVVGSIICIPFSSCVSSYSSFSVATALLFKANSNSQISVEVLVHQEYSSVHQWVIFSWQQLHLSYNINMYHRCVLPVSKQSNNCSYTTNI